MSSTQPSNKTTYAQGHDKSITQTHANRTAQSDAAFLLPHLEPGMSILDVGCGPGTITTGFLPYVDSTGSVTGVDYAQAVIDQAQEHSLTTAPDAKNLSFQVADIYQGLPFEDNTFDVVFASQVLLHLTDVVSALREMRRVTKPGGIVAVRDSDSFSFHPFPAGLQKWDDGMWNCIIASKSRGRYIRGFAHEAGFSYENITTGAGTTCFSTPEQKRWWSEAHMKRFESGDWVRKFRDGGFSEEDVENMKEGWREWARDENGWYVCVQAENLLRK